MFTNAPNPAHGSPSQSTGDHQWCHSVTMNGRARPGDGCFPKMPWHSCISCRHRRADADSGRWLERPRLCPGQLRAFFKAVIHCIFGGRGTKHALSAMRTSNIQSRFRKFLEIYTAEWSQTWPAGSPNARFVFKRSLTIRDILTIAHRFRASLQCMVQIWIF